MGGLTIALPCPDVAEHPGKTEVSSLSDLNWPEKTRAVPSGWIRCGLHYGDDARHASFGRFCYSRVRSFPPASTCSSDAKPSAAVSTPSVRVPADARKVRAQHDYNGDGYADLAIGLGGRDEVASTRVQVFYGAPEGATNRNCQIIAEGTVTAPNRIFGYSLTSGDFDGDDYADLAIGGTAEDPWEDENGEVQSGNDLTIVFGAEDGLSGKHVKLTQARDHPLAAGSLAAGDFNKDRYQDLAVTAGYENELWIAYGGRGIRTGKARWMPVLLDTTDIGSLAAGDVTGDGYDDLAVSYSMDDPADEGTGVVFRGSPTGLAGRVEGTFPGWDVSDVAIGDLDGDGYGDVIAGMPHLWAEEDKRGVIYVSMGTARGLAKVRALGLSSLGTPPALRALQGFGGQVAIGDVDADGYADVAVSASSYDLSVGKEPGAVVLLRGGRNGLSEHGAQFLWPKDGGILDTEVSGFGDGVALTDFTSDGTAELTVATSNMDIWEGVNRHVSVIFPDGRGRPVQLAFEHVATDE